MPEMRETQRAHPPFSPLQEQEVLRKARLRDLGLDSAIQPNEQDIAIVARVVERGESTRPSRTDSEQGQSLTGIPASTDIGASPVS